MRTKSTDELFEALRDQAVKLEFFHNVYDISKLEHSEVVLEELIELKSITSTLIDIFNGEY